MEFDVMFPSWLGAVMKEMENSVWNGMDKSRQWLSDVSPSGSSRNLSESQLREICQLSLITQ